MQENYDYMRFPVRGSNDFWQVIRTGYRSYNAIFLSVDVFPDLVRVLSYKIDLNQYSDEELANYVANWGYKDFASFTNYLENQTEVKNYELRLCTCIIENEPFMEPELLFEGDLEEAGGFVHELLKNTEKFEINPENLKC